MPFSSVQLIFAPCEGHSSYWDWKQHLFPYPHTANPSPCPSSSEPGDLSSSSWDRVSGSLAPVCWRLSIPAHPCLSFGFPPLASLHSGRGCAHHLARWLTDLQQPPWRKPGCASEHIWRTLLLVTDGSIRFCIFWSVDSLWSLFWLIIRLILLVVILTLFYHYLAFLIAFSSHLSPYFLLSVTTYF